MSNYRLTGAFGVLLTPFGADGKVNFANFNNGVIDFKKRSEKIL